MDNFPLRVYYVFIQGAVIQSQLQCDQRGFPFNNRRYQREPDERAPRLHGHVDVIPPVSKNKRSDAHLDASPSVRRGNRAFRFRW